MRNPTSSLYQFFLSSTISRLIAPALSLLTVATFSSANSTPPTAEELDQMFLAGPTAISSIGMRTVWQSKVTLQSNESAK
ncbi:MAG: hypothetical protein WCL33_11490, partial [Planctomycetota bacterium]